MFRNGSYRIDIIPSASNAMPPSFSLLLLKYNCFFGMSGEDLAPYALESPGYRFAKHAGSGARVEISLLPAQVDRQNVAALTEIDGRFRCAVFAAQEHGLLNTADADAIIIKYENYLREQKLSLGLAHKVNRNGNVDHAGPSAVY